MPLVLEIGGAVEAEARREYGVFLWRERLLHRLAIPNVEAALVAFRVGVQAGVECAVTARVGVTAQLTQQPFHGTLDGVSEQPLTGRGRRLGVDREQQRVVVQHLLEMRYFPARVHRIAAEAPSELVEQAAFRHARQAQRGHVQRLQIGRVVARAGVPVAQQTRQSRGMREFRCRAKAAIVAVEALFQPRTAGLQGLGRQARAGGRRRIEVLDRADDLGGRHPQLLLVLVVVACHLAQQIAKSGQAEARFAREIGAAEEWPLVVVQQEHGQRPAAAAAGEHLVRQLVEAIQVGALFAIDLDAHIQLVHRGRDGLILERFMCHHMAPVAGGIADRQQDRLVFAPGPLQRFGPPAIPVHRIVRVLAQVRAGLVGEPVSWLRTAFVHGPAADFQ